MELICTSEFFKKLKLREPLRKMFLEAIFSHARKLFQSFRTKFLSLLYKISLAYKISHCLATNHYPELRCVICTGVTLFAPVLRLNCTALSQSESSGFLMCIINMITGSFHVLIFNGTFHVDKIHVWFKIANITHALLVPGFSHRNGWSFRVYMIP